MSKPREDEGAGAQAPVMGSISELLAHALALEEEATERYAELAEIMEAHNNPDAAQLFARMAKIEQHHVAEVRKEIERRGLEDLAPAEYHWVGMEGPETTDHADLHYLMTPRQALLLALTNERRARDYFGAIAGHATDPEVAQFAGEMAEEEKEHVEWVERWLEQFPEPEQDWDQDDDPPILQG